MKKIICVVLIFSMLLTCFASAAYDPSATEMVGKWGYTPGGDPVLIDSYEAEHFAISVYYDGDTVYSITIMDNGDVDFAWAGGNTVPGNVITTLDDLNVVVDQGDLDIISDNAFIDAVKDFGVEHVENAISTMEITFEEPSASTTAYNQSDYNTLMSQMRGIHGYEYTNRNWTSLAYEHYNGLMFSYKEDLDYGLVYRGDLGFDTSTTFGQLCSLMFSVFAEMSTPVGVLATLLDVANAVNSYLTASGRISYYYGDAIYNRYVLIENGGPYDQSFHNIYYDGWTVRGGINKLELVETGNVYRPTQDIFNSHTAQRARAYANY